MIPRRPISLYLFLSRPVKYAEFELQLSFSLLPATFLLDAPKFRFSHNIQVIIQLLGILRTFTVKVFQLFPLNGCFNFGYFDLRVFVGIGDFGLGCFFALWVFWPGVLWD